MRETKSNIRLYIKTDLITGVSIDLSADHTHYLKSVMRRKIGDRLSVFNGRDGQWDAEIMSAGRNTATLKIHACTREQSTEPDIWLVFAPLKKARMDYMIQKATELGASSLVPIYTRRTVADRVNIDRMQANTVEAAEQCERLTVPTVMPAEKIADTLRTWPSDRAIMFCDENLSGRSVTDVLKENKTLSTNNKWAIFIGPEGGFDDAERALIKSMPKTVTVSLGPRVLRADTAAISALSLWQSCLGDW